jgi:outer membrane immunogenic protein
MLRKCLILVYAVLIGSSTFVWADDVSTNRYNWSGPYVGLNGGWAKAASKSSTTGVFSPNGTAPAYLWEMDRLAFNTAGNPALRSDNFVGGIQGGYNRQFGRFVLGGEIDLNSMNINNGEAATTGLPSWPGSRVTFRSSINTDWLMTVRPRIGYAFQNWLFYATGGLAITKMKSKWAYWDSRGLGESDSASKVKPALILGGGVEVGLWKNWSIKGEYLYADFGKVSGSGVCPSFGIIQSSPFHHKTDLKTHIVRAGLNYRF